MADTCGHAIEIRDTSRLGGARAFYCLQPPGHSGLHLDDVQGIAWQPFKHTGPSDASRTDRQPPNPVAGAKGGETSVGPAATNHPDLVTHHEET